MGSVAPGSVAQARLVPGVVQLVALAGCCWAPLLLVASVSQNQMLKAGVVPCWSLLTQLLRSLMKGKSGACANQQVHHVCRGAVAQARLVVTCSATECKLDLAAAHPGTAAAQQLYMLAQQGGLVGNHSG